MILIPFLAVLVGVVIGLLMNHPFTGGLGQYLAVGCLAGMDTVCGGIRSGYEGKFHSDIFLSGFVTNLVIAIALAWLGDKIYIDLYQAVALVLGWRIFTNLSLIRRSLLNQWRDSQERRRQEKIAHEARISAASTADSPSS